MRGCMDRKGWVQLAGRAVGAGVDDIGQTACMTVLLAYVPTPEGDAALAAAVEEARRRAVGAVVVHVPRPADATTSPYSVEQVLDAVLARFTSTGVAAEMREVPAGTDTADALIDVARETGAEVVVIGLRRRTPVGKLVLGSTSSRLLLGLDCPVLAVKAAG
jgi:nucleotide-binding universal stress UspA family protein